MEKPFWKSATKIVLLLFALASVVLTWFRVIDGADFVNMVLIVLSFYFGQKTLPQNK